MELKRSMYNIIINENKEGTLFYNSASGSFVNFNKDAKNLYDKLEKCDLYNLTNKEEEYLDIMKQQGFIIPKDIDEKKMLKLRENLFKYNSKTLSLTVAPTMNCNMNCPYCYENKSNSTMSEEVENNLIKFIEKGINSNGYKAIVVTWYGGEPLLCKNIIYRLSNKIIDLCKENNVDYTSYMVTNGTLLDKETAKILKEDCKVSSIQITLDGIGETNNKRRLLKNNGNSFELIVENIKNIRDIINIQIRVNLDKSNFTEVDDIIEFFYNNEEINSENVYVYFAPVINDSEFCLIKKNQCYSMNEFAKLHLDISQKMKKYNILPRYPFAKDGACSATSASSYVVDPDGDLYKCWNEVNIKEKSVGNLNSGVKLNGRFIEWLNINLKDNCKECKIMPACLGGCPYNIIENNEVECDYTNVNYKQTLELYYENYIEKKLNK